MNKITVILVIISLLLITSCNDQAPKLDLSNCAQYYDGCNSCAVEDGKPTVCTEMFCEEYGEPKCIEYK